YNAPGARVVAEDGGGLLSLNDGQLAGAIFEADASFVTINAASVTNRGDITVGGNGLMKLFANELDLTGGTPIVQPSISTLQCFGFGVDVSETNFFPALGVYDLGYGIDVVTNMPIAGIVQSTDPNVIQTPSFRITNSLSVGAFTRWCQTSLTLSNAYVWM